MKMKSIDFEVKKYSILSGKIKAQVSKICRECFHARMSKKELKEGKDKHYHKGYAHILAIEKGSVISTVELFKRIIKYKGKKIILGGIGGVCTVKRRRKIGIASLLLKKSMKDLRKHRCDVAFLATNVKNPKLVRLYRKVGFTILRQPYTFIGKSGKRYGEKSGMIAPVKSKAKFNLILKGKETLNIGFGGI